MTTDQLKKYYVTWANAMRKLELGVNSYRYWVDIGFIPIKAQRRIQKKTKGALKLSTHKEEKKDKSINGTINNTQINTGKD